MTPDTPRRRRRRQRLGVDLVAAILAVGLACLVVLILVATTIQILHNKPGVPEIQLSENATQVLIAAIGGMVGILGGYVGHRLQHHSDNQEGSDNDT